MTNMRGRVFWWMATPLVRIAFGLVCLTISLVLTGDVLVGLTPEHMKGTYRYRRALTENLAVQYSVLASRGAIGAIGTSIKELVARNPDIASTVLRAANGAVLAEAGDHQRHWIKPAGDQSTLNHVQVPIFDGAVRWGTLEVSFAESPARGLTRLWGNPLFRLLAFIATAGFVIYLLFMRRTLRHLDPLAVVPERVRATLDVLAEGVLLLDNDERIVLANAAFAERLNRPISSLLGFKVSTLDWVRSMSADSPAEYPWVEARRQAASRKGALLELSMDEGETRKFVVNSAPIVDGKGTVRGVVATFDDVTALEKTNAHLRELTRELEASQREVTRQNHELRHLAERDPLTGCFNRRAFFGRIEAAWAAARSAGEAVGCIMVDIDRFKSVNDNHGHAVGDQVIQVVARTLGSGLRITDVLARFGGEEFCILLPGLGTTETAAVAERLRGAIETHGGPAIRTVSDLRVTASFGVASYQVTAGMDPEQLIDHADQALILAKQTGRNRVVRWDQIGREEGSREGGSVAVGARG